MKMKTQPMTIAAADAVSTATVSVMARPDDRIWFFTYHISPIGPTPRDHEAVHHHPRLQRRADDRRSDRPRVDGRSRRSRARGDHRQRRLERRHAPGDRLE